MFFFTKQDLLGICLSVILLESLGTIIHKFLPAHFSNKQQSYEYADTKIFINSCLIDHPFFFSDFQSFSLIELHLDKCRNKTTPNKADEIKLQQ